jgi:26S proteasome non-ATPase regulatory subunit 9
MRQPLVDGEGFPRDDLDVWAVRHARVRIIELRNDLAALMDEIAKTLETVYRRSPPPQAEGEGTSRSTVSGETTTSELLPFARVNGVAPGSPAADAVRPSLSPIGAAKRFALRDPNRPLCCARVCKETTSL